MLPMSPMKVLQPPMVSELSAKFQNAKPAAPSSETPLLPPSSANLPSAMTSAEAVAYPEGPICDALYRVLTVIATGSTTYRSPMVVAT